MEALRQDDPRRIGPYTALARFRETASTVQYIAHGVAAGRDGGATGGPVLLTVARPELAALPAFRRRFQAEARTADRLAGGWVQHLDAPADDTDDGLLWTAGPYLPALTLSEAIEVTGPLPERAVRILGAGIAETLSRVHATGAVLQGLAPGTVLLAEDGPRLTAFGPLAAAAAAEARPGGQLSVRLAYLTPEQVEGEQPGPTSDLFVLGLLLAYAATGTTPLADGPAAEGAERIARTDPELGAVPTELRELIARCLAKDPADRPTAGTVATELALEGAAGLAKGGWLPERLLAELAEQGVRVRELVEAGQPADAPVVTPEPAATTSPAPAGDTRTTQLGDIGRHVPTTDRPTTQLSVPRQLAGPPAGPSTGPSVGSAAGLPAVLPPVAPMPPHPLPVPVTPAPSPASASASPTLGRRGLFVGLAAGAAGLVVGGGGVLAFGSGDGGTTDGPEPAPSHSGATVAGLPPQPRWVYRHPAAEPPPLTATLWNDRLLVVTGEQGAAGIDLRTGRRVWESADAAKGRAALPAGKDLCFVAGPTEFLWLSPKDGKVVHRAGYVDQFTDTPGLVVSHIVGTSGPVVWFTGAHKVTVKAPPPKKGKKRGKDTQVVRSYLFAYDVLQRKELWRTPVSTGRGPAAPVYRLIATGQDDFVVRQSPATLTPGDVKAAKGKAVFRSFDQKTGKQLWSRSFGLITPDAAALGDDRDVLYAAVGDDLQAFELPAGKPKWVLNGTTGTPYGTPVATGTLLHTTNRNQEVGAVERETGRLRWRRSTEAAPGAAAPAVTLSTTGRTLLAADASQVTAFTAKDGRRLWKFQDIGAQDPKGPTVTAPYRVLVSGTSAVIQRDRIFYAFPVA
ncbi:PQQ-binding-like beta-propeller repeat protein [Streptomyces sp. NBC_01618]|uniref:outer membrane protein assembly factor BamB family protein n=1 Tax=Streptomyces sp. NBC_01618 TaxID=2975900 RepID=UPI0038709899|nr:PQQ-binding-like beta-propeller repeat protein [Streptomyces sp. NBC_01618]